MLRIYTYVYPRKVLDYHEVVIHTYYYPSGTNVYPLVVVQVYYYPRVVVEYTSTPQ